MGGSRPPASSPTSHAPFPRRSRSCSPEARRAARISPAAALPPPPPPTPSLFPLLLAAAPWAWSAARSTPELDGSARMAAGYALSRRFPAVPDAGVVASSLVGVAVLCSSVASCGVMVLQAPFGGLRLRHACGLQGFAEVLRQRRGGVAGSGLLGCLSTTLWWCG